MKVVILKVALYYVNPITTLMAKRHTSLIIRDEKLFSQLKFCAEQLHQPWNKLVWDIVQGWLDKRFTTTLDSFINDEQVYIPHILDNRKTIYQNFNKMSVESLKRIEPDVTQFTDIYHSVLRGKKFSYV